MTKKNSLITRILAFLALAAAIVVVYVVVTDNMESDEGSGKSNQGKTAKQGKNAKQSKPKAKTYEVKGGDTLTGIAAKTGVSVDRIERLNPDLDPQALIAGEKLKLR